MPLEEYRAKRDFAITPEPVGGSPSPDALRFVVQQHAATRMHWDFRLELDGVLLSWAVPKGPSLDPRDKRLAVRTEDHPIDYADFEGKIPDGEYGAGSVIVWDRGTWKPIGDPRAGMTKGDFKFELRGEKLEGRWVLVRLKPRGNERGENWLLIKERDEHARASLEFDVVRDLPRSVLSGLTVAQIGEDPGAAVWTDGATTRDTPDVPALPELALCTLVTKPPVGPGWLAEVKYDGHRIRVVLQDGHARCVSRSGVDVSDRFAPLARAAERLAATSAVLDGEAVVFDERGTTDFAALTEAMSQDPTRITLAAFDLTYLNGRDLTNMSTLARKDLLGALLANAPDALHLAPYVADETGAFLEAACAQGLEGAVYKREDAPYPSGRTRAWLKVKCRLRQEFVIVGYTEAAESQAGFGALLLGHHAEDGKLVYAGRVGSGFAERARSELSATLASLERVGPALGGAALELATRPAARSGGSVHWVEPRLVAEVAFAGWTPQGIVRQASFKGLRTDVDPATVGREVPAPVELDEGHDRASDAPVSTDTPTSIPTWSEPTSRSVSGVRITNPDKRLFAGSDFTKIDLARYYETVGPVMLAEVADRPLTLVRCPVGEGTGCFYQRHPERGLPGPVKRVAHRLADHDESDEWLYVDDVCGLVALAQMGVAEIHTWLSRTSAPSKPDRIVFDLDPGPGVPWTDVLAAARLLRDETAALGFSPFVKSTGGKGLHVVLPVKPVWEFASVHELSRRFAVRVCSLDPGRLTPKMAKTHRDGRIFVDYVRNSEGASVVAPYSTRFSAGPSVAVPLAWEELDDTALDTCPFTPAHVLDRLAAGVDPWRGIDDASAGPEVLESAKDALA